MQLFIFLHLSFSSDTRTDRRTDRHSDERTVCADGLGSGFKFGHRLGFWWILVMVALIVIVSSFVGCLLLSSRVLVSILCGNLSSK